MATKKEVRHRWEQETAGFRYGEGEDNKAFYGSVEKQRYSLEPYIPAFAQFELYGGKRVLEIGVGGGVDFTQFVRHGALATGVELTSAGIRHTIQQLQGLPDQKGTYSLAQADAEDLCFVDNSFDLVYSWGVLHHTPDTVRAFSEAFRVMKPGASLKAMVYHTPSWTGWMLWMRFALLRGRPFVSPRRCVYEHLESPGTKVYTVAEARRILEDLGFGNIRISTKLGPGDVLIIKPSQRFQGALYKAIWALYPRWLVRLLGDRFGQCLIVTAEKPLNTLNSEAT